jgi:hypothetical protein
MRRIIFFIVVIVSTLIIGCRKDFTTELNTGKLQFSKDTVFLDTVFSNIGSSTYQLKVYNKSNNAIKIPSIRLGQGENSFYRLNIDGSPGKNFENIEILANDSIYIFIETTINYSQINNPLYTDALIFDSDTFQQRVELITLVKDANFLYPSKNAQGLIETINIGQNANGEHIEINGFYLPNNTTFTNEKPYVIYGYCAVAPNQNLTINPGTKIYFHANSGLIVSKNATLSINGSIENNVIIEGDRLEPTFSNIPGQWGAIWLRAGSKNNLINNTIIKNASVGIICDSIGSTSTPTLTVKNTQIYNSSNYGILGRETNIYGENLVINNSGLSSLACTIGGNYNFIHATFTNFWNNSYREFPTVFINNYYSYTENNKQIIVPKNLIAANFTNCIIDGSNNIELLLDKVEGATFNYTFKNNLLKFNDLNNSYAAILEYDFTNTSHYQNNIFNGITNFKSPQNNMLIIGEKSDAIKKAFTESSEAVPNDILGVARTIPADIGAYQHITFEN